MTTMNVFIVQFVLLFILAICVIELYLYVRRGRSLNRHEIKAKVKKFSITASSAENPDILRNRKLSNVEFLNKILVSIPIFRRLDRLMQQANLNYPLGFLILLSLLLMTIGFYCTTLLTRNYVISLGVALAVGALPFLYLRMKKRERMQKFEQQLPEGLDFLARALKAGHAFTGSMKLATENFEDPLGTEFERTLDEVNFGISTNDALKHLLDRIDSQDLRYFVVSVILQRETGGNLAEIMESIAHIIRERFKFRDKIRVLSAEGKMSGVLLCALPFLIICYLQIVNPTYLEILLTDRLGQIIAIISASMMSLGILLMRKTTKIEI